MHSVHRGHRRERIAQPANESEGKNESERIMLLGGWIAQVQPLSWLRHPAIDSLRCIQRPTAASARVKESWESLPRRYRPPRCRRLPCRSTRVIGTRVFLFDADYHQ